jgi:Domain of unknown function (DUF3471)/Domain of unknown function (DUF4440)
MKRTTQKIITTVLCWLCFVTMTLATLAQAPTTNNDAKVKDEIRALLLQLNEAGLKEDGKTWDRILAPGYTTTHQFTDKLINKDAALRSVAKGEMGAPPELKVTMSVEDLELTHNQHTAVALYHLIIKYETKEGPFESRVRTMSCFVRNETIWQLLAEEGKLLPPTRTPRKVETKALDAIVGEYQAEEGQVVAVTREGDKLFSQKTGNPKFELVPANDATFYARVMAEAESTYTFIRNDAGKVTQMVIQNPLPASTVLVRKKIK